MGMPNDQPQKSPFTELIKHTHILYIFVSDPVYAFFLGSGSFDRKSFDRKQLLLKIDNRPFKRRFCITLPKNNFTENF
jgi:hypothetical protein